MGQIVGGAAKPKRCNINQLSQLGTPAAGEHILVSSDNSMNAAGQGNFDCYIVGDGRTVAAMLKIKQIPDTLSSGNASVDLAFSDGNGYDIAVFENGEVRTKKFNSKTDAPLKEQESHVDLELADNDDNVLVQFANGHIRTKNFNSMDLKIPAIAPKLKGKKVAFLGDSITYGQNASPSTNRYSTLFCTKEECTEVNLGVSGTCIAANTSNGMNAQRFITRATSTNLSTCDIIFVWGGTNDFSYDIKAIGEHFVEQTITGAEYIGIKKLIPPSDTETFAGALHELILQIRNVAPNAQIYFIQPLNRGRYNTTRPTSAESNVNGNYLEEFRKAIKDICTFYAIKVVEMNTMLGQDWQFDETGTRSSYSADGLHPNNAGHKRIAELLAQWVENNVII